MIQQGNAARVRGFLETFVGDADFADSDDIFALGLVNSLMAMQLVLFLEKEFGIKFANEDLNLQNFRSINAITGLLETKGVAAAPV